MLSIDSRSIFRLLDFAVLYSFSLGGHNSNHSHHVRFRLFSLNMSCCRATQLRRAQQKQCDGEIDPYLSLRSPSRSLATPDRAWPDAKVRLHRDAPPWCVSSLPSPCGATLESSRGISLSIARALRGRFVEKADGLASGDQIKTSGLGWRMNG